jgi:hypothetical protein
MRKALIFILLALFTGLTAFAGQSVNGPGIKGFTEKYETQTALAAEAAAVAVPAIGLTGVFPVITSIGPITISAVPIPFYGRGIIPASMADGLICYDKGCGVFECIMPAYPDIRKGGVLSFGSAMKPGI